MHLDLETDDLEAEVRRLEALGATRWEVIRGVVLPTTLSGVTAATILALGRALGEAIAVSLVIGDAPGQTIDRSGVTSSAGHPGAAVAS